MRNRKLRQLRMKILIIEDENEMVESITESLRRQQFVVEKAQTLNDARDKLSAHSYDCILLDINLPDGNGIDILRMIRAAKKRDRVIILSARDSLDDKLTGLDLGADDYLTKPFHLAELNARLKAVIRRNAFDGQETLTIGNLSVDVRQHSVAAGDITIPLNRKEFDILMYFLANKNRLVSKTSIAEHVWGDHTDEADNFEFVYSQIKNLRKKLKDHGADVEIKAVYGVGYRLETEK